MKVEPPNIRVFVSSESAGNPYERDELARLNTGLYCETVMKTRKLLLVPDALVDEDWNANPDIKLGMISYMGLPVAWPKWRRFRHHMHSRQQAKCVRRALPETAVPMSRNASGGFEVVASEQ
jgi:hypothetical protein